MERDNLSLKHQILVMQRKKARQALDYSRARTRLILLTQGKLQEEILKLQQEVKAHRSRRAAGTGDAAKDSADLWADLSTTPLWGTCRCLHESVTTRSDLRPSTVENRESELAAGKSSRGI